MKALGKKIVTQLSKDCGYRNRGVYTRKSAYLKYSNGQRADYYGVIRDSVYRGIPAMIVEHGYIDSSDYVRMNSAAKCKKMGVADAKAIVSYYGLKKRSADDSNILVSSIKLNVNDTALNLKKGKRYSLKATVAPSIATEKGVTYESSDSKILKVTKAGKVTALKKGTAQVICKAEDSSGVSRELTIKVK